MAFKEGSSVVCSASENQKVHGILHFKLIQFFKQNFWKMRGNIFFSQKEASEVVRGWEDH